MLLDINRSRVPTAIEAILQQLHPDNRYCIGQDSGIYWRLIDGTYRLLTPNERDRYTIPPLGVELGIWQGTYKNFELPWLRWWDGEGNLLLSGNERAERESQRAEQVEQENAHLRERLQSLGIDPETL